MRGRNLANFADPSYRFAKGKGVFHAAKAALHGETVN